jgi:hypothetical protein
MKALRPKNYIKVTEETQKYECIIYNYITDHPYVCSGPCRQTFCLQCVT